MTQSPYVGRPKVVNLDRQDPYGGYNEIRRWSNGTTCYLLDGQFHRLDGPAFVDAKGNKAWHRHGREHREGGPAVEFSDGHIEYWVDGVQLGVAQYAAVRKPERSGIRRLLGWKRR